MLILCSCKTCNTHALPIPFVADQMRTMVSDVHGSSRRASQKPPQRSTTDSPFCQMETAAPNSPKRVKFSSKSGPIRFFSTSASNFILDFLSEGLRVVRFVLQQERFHLVQTSLQQQQPDLTPSPSSHRPA